MDSSKHEVQQKLILSVALHLVYHEGTKELTNILHSVQKYLTLPVLPKHL